MGTTNMLGSGRYWFGRAFARNPLVRPGDRFEAILLMVLLAVVVLSASVAGAIGTGVCESRSRMYAEELRDRHPASATVIADSATSSQRLQLVETAPVRWSHNGIEHIDTVRVDPTTESDDSVDIWVDENGDPMLAPRSTSWAAVDAALIGGGSWAAMIAVAAAIWKALRFSLARRRAAAWDRGLRALVDDRGGRTGYQS